MKVVKETLADPTLVNMVEENLRNLFQNEPNQIHSETKRIESELALISLKKQNLMKAIEVGTNGNAVEFLTNRLSELLNKEQDLQRKLHQIQSELTDAHDHVSDWSDAVARFVLNFETEFESAPIEDRKSLIRKCIARIVVDREKGVAKVYVRRIPAVTPELQRLLEPADDRPAIAGTPKNKELTPHGVSSVSARNRT
ncbi:MAG TPA: hypothetical protein DEP53_17200 [Bacteroidetes bacterium]|nr:hypothetical protein [Bacteroidota bacterium]